MSHDKKEMQFVKSNITPHTQEGLRHHKKYTPSNQESTGHNETIAEHIDI